jgi:hypothetical protein
MSHAASRTGPVIAKYDLQQSKVDAQVHIGRSNGYFSRRVLKA